MSRLTKPFVFALFLVFAFSGAHAQGGFKVKARNVTDLLAEQRQVLGGWCRQDFDGARLSADSWQKMAPFTALKDNPDFSKITVVSRYDIQRPEQYSNVATVTYYVLGEYEPGAGYIANPDRRDVSFRLVNKDDRLVISEIDTTSPFVSKATLLKYLNDKKQAAKSDLERADLQRAIDSLTQTQPASAAK